MNRSALVGIVAGGFLGHVCCVLFIPVIDYVSEQDTLDHMNEHELLSVVIGAAAGWLIGMCFGKVHTQRVRRKGGTEQKPPPSGAVIWPPPPTTGGVPHLDTARGEYDGDRRTGADA